MPINGALRRFCPLCRACRGRDCLLCAAEQAAMSGRRGAMLDAQVTEMLQGGSSRGKGTVCVSLGLGHGCVNRKIKLSSDIQHVIRG